MTIRCSAFAIARPSKAADWDADAGLRIRSPLDPFVKGSYNFYKGSSESTL